jgi:cytochrome c-type biogenesis protein CcmH/NrfG
MDRLDKFSLFAMVVLLMSSLALIGNHKGEAQSPQDDAQGVSSHRTVTTLEIKHKIESIRGVLEEGNLSKAEMLANELMQEHPHEGDPRILLGDIFMRKQEPIMAALTYRDAVDINPDYLDKQAPIFQGKKMERAVREALAEVERNIEKNPDDATMKKYRKGVYYLQRRLAGGCS